MSSNWDEKEPDRESSPLAEPMQVYDPAVLSYQHSNSNALLPSAMPLPNTDDAFYEGNHKASSFSPPDTGDTDNTFPPKSPNDSLEGEKSHNNKDKQDKDLKKNKKKTSSGPAPLYKPSLSLLFSLSTRNDKLTLLLPAILFSLAAGVVPPIMTFVLGDAFDQFTTYQTNLSYQSTLPKSLQDMSKANSKLKNGMMKIAIELIVLGILAVLFTTAALWLWVWHGERIAKRLRYKMYIGVIAKPMAWFDLGMGKRIGESAGLDDGEEDVVGENESSGGLMGRFTR